MELRPYQREDVEFIKQHPCCGVFNEQRTGKTPTTLVALNEMNANKILIICPASTVPQWKEEFETWLGKPCIAITGKTPTKKIEQVKQWTNGLVVSYDSFKSTDRGIGLVNEVLKQKPDAVVADEAHRIKNHKSLNFAALKACCNIPIRLALTGTPAPNKAHEIYGILHFLYPQRFSSYWKFIDYYFTQEIKFTRNRKYIEIGKFKPGKRTELQNFLNNHCTQRKRKDIMQWLPEKDRQQIKLEPTDNQQKYLEELTKYFEIAQANVVTKTLLDRLIRVRQVCLDPAILGLPKGDSPKTDWIKQYLQDYSDISTIIFSKSTRYLLRLQTDLNKPEEIGLIIGATPIEKRNQIKKDFQNGKLKVLLINIDAGKEGLTLDKAETIIFTDKFPPVGDIAQAEDRFIATTEDKANKQHLIIELMMKGTYDEQLYQLIQKRFSETDVINDFKKYIERGKENGNQANAKRSV